MHARVVLFLVWAPEAGDCLCIPNDLALDEIDGLEIACVEACGGGGKECLRDEGVIVVVDGGGSSSSDVVAVSKRRRRRRRRRRR